jgi:hypothetical protein
VQQVLRELQVQRVRQAQEGRRVCVVCAELQVLQAKEELRVLQGLKEQQELREQELQVRRVRPGLRDRQVRIQE